MNSLPVLAGVGVAFTVIIVALHSWFLVKQRRWFAFDPLNTFWAGVLVCYVLQPLAHAATFVQWQGRDVVTATTWWIAVSLVPVAAGYNSRLGPQIGRRIPHPPVRLHPRKLFLSSWVLIGLGLMGYVYQMASAGGLRAWASVARGGTDWARVSAYTAGLAKLLPLGSILLLFHVEMHRVPRSRRVLSWALAWLIWLWFLYLGSRSRVIAQTAMMLSALYLPRRRQPRLAFLALGFVVLLVIVNFQVAYRGNFTNFSLNLGRVDWGELGNRILGDAAESPSSSGETSVSRGIEFNCVMTTIKLVPSAIPYNYGYPLLELFTRWIPRAVWPGKIYPGLEANFPIFHQGGLSQTWVKTSRRALLMGPALTFVGYWWAVGGPIALFLGGFLTGTMLRAIRTLYNRRPGSQGDLLLYNSLFLVGFTEAAATPLVWLYSVPFTLLPLVLVFRICRVRRGTGYDPRLVVLGYRMKMPLGTCRSRRVMRMRHGPMEALNNDSYPSRQGRW